MADDRKCADCEQCRCIREVLAGLTLSPDGSLGLDLELIAEDLDVAEFVGPSLCNKLAVVAGKLTVLPWAVGATQSVTYSPRSYGAGGVDGPITGAVIQVAAMSLAVANPSTCQPMKALVLHQFPATQAGMRQGQFWWTEAAVPVGGFSQPGNEYDSQHPGNPVFRARRRGPQTVPELVSVPAGGSVTVTSGMWFHPGNPFVNHATNSFWVGSHGITAIGVNT